MTTLSELLRLQEEASEAPWSLEHDDRAIAAPERQRGDWDWICLPPESDDDEEMLGAKLKENMRFIAAARNFDFVSLQTQYEAMREWVLKAEHTKECEADKAFVISNVTNCRCGLFRLRASLDTKARGDG